MSQRARLIGLLAAALAVASIAAPSAVAQGGGTTRQIALAPSAAFPHASGKAVYKVNGSRRELQIEVEHIRALAGKHVNVFVNGSKLASPVVNALGSAGVNRDTERGQAVPRIVSG